MVKVEVSLVVALDVADVVPLVVPLVVGVVRVHSLKVPSACDSTAAFSSATVAPQVSALASATNLFSMHVNVPAVPNLNCQASHCRRLWRRCLR